MKGKATVIAPSNIAFVKYWGTKDLTKVEPFNPSVSMTLERCASHTTVEVDPALDEDQVWWIGEDGAPVSPSDAFREGVTKHLDCLREQLGSTARFRVATHNSFPTGTGIASSASGFAALALAVVAALARDLPIEEISILARLSGSGSAARSVMGGFVEWPAQDREGGVATMIASPDHWDLRDVIAVVDAAAKQVSSRVGHRRAPSSPYFVRRLELLPERLEQVRKAILECDFPLLAAVVEQEAVDLHLIAMSSQPPIFYWQAGTLRVLETVRELRESGVEVCSTMDAGANVHLICTAEAEERVIAALRSIDEVQDILRDRVGRGPRLVEEHLL